MAKYSFELKKQIVLEYLSGGGGSDFLAKKYNVPYANRNIFLDNENNLEYILGQLEKTEKIALKHGYAIAIGHVGAEGGENTARAILDTIPKIKEMGVEIVPLHEIYENLKTK